MKETTELVFIMDKSGSMAGKEEDSVGGFNATIEEQKEKGNEVYVTAVLFSDNHEIVIDRMDIREVKKMERKDFRVGGCTALVDTIGNTIEHIGKVQHYDRSGKIDNTVFIIITDGLENASHRYSSDEVKKMIRAKEETGWKFLFLGANIDAVETAKSFGIREDYAVNYHNDRKGIRAVYGAVSRFVDACADECELSEGSWRAEVDKDYRNRKES